MAQIPYETALDILNNIKGLSVIDTKGNYIFLNKLLAEQFGTTQEEAIGHPAANFIEDPKLLRILETKKPEWGKYSQTIPKNAPPCPPCMLNRVLMYPDADSTQAPIGAIAYTTMSYTNASTDPTEAFLKEFEQLQQQVEMLQTHLGEVYHTNYEVDEILGRSEKLRTVKDTLHRVAPTAATVCILGETGTGKELIANALHKLSSRKDKPFVKINCAAIPKDLLESELFGYEAGAFTGASKQGKIGKFEIANGGTLLLDEIGELPLDLQAKLLRAIQSGELERVGGMAPIPIDVRFICSTNRDLQKMVESGTFRADLYYRISVVEVKMPPLRERLVDIPLLVDHFVLASNQRNHLSISGVTDEAYRFLQSRDWPGNIRELENCVERACIFCGRGLLTSEHFSFMLEKANHTPIISMVPASLDEVERETIVQMLARCEGNKTKAARMLNIARSTMYEKIRKYQIEV